MFDYRRITAVARPLMIVAAVVLLATGCNPDGSPVDRAHRASDGAECTVGVVGDSLTVGADEVGGLRAELEQRGCSVTAIDARVGRPTSEGAAVVESWSTSGHMPQVLVVGLGTNDCSEALFLKQMQRILRAAGPNRPVVWINTFHQGCDKAINGVINNQSIVDYFSRTDHGRLWVHDYHSWIASNPDLMRPDSIHLNADGYRAHAVRIADFVVGR